jgi:hypothetical protein
MREGMMISLKKFMFALGVTACLFGPVSIVAAGDIASESISQDRPKASEILKRAYRYLESLERFSFDATTSNEDLYAGKMIIELTHHINVEVERPDRLRIDIAGDVKNRSIYFNQGHFTLLETKTGFYGQLEIPKTIDKALDFLYDTYHIKTPLANLLYSDLLERLGPKKEGYYFGSTLIGKTVCDYVGFSNRSREFQVWIERGDRPLIRKFVIIDKTLKRHLRSTTTIDWNTHPLFFGSSFAFTPPRNGVKIDIETPKKEMR